MEKKFNDVFEGVSKTLDAIDDELALLKKINAEQKVELNKSKRFNIIMFAVSIVSLVLSAVSLGIAFI